MEGTELPDVVAAKHYAVEVAHELMRYTELKKRAWRLDVCDDGGRLILAVPFAEVDPTLDHLGPDLRQLVQRLSESKRCLSETIFNAESLARGMRAAEARRHGKPYIVAHLGRRVDAPLREPAW
jgi:hypothetical protein